MKRLAMVVALTAAVALAQGPGRFRSMSADGAPTPPTDKVTTYLALTSTQLTQLQQIRQDEFTANQTLHQQIADKESALRTALESTSPTAAELGGLMLDIKNLRDQLKQNRTKYQTQALALLNDVQKPKLQALQDAASLAPTIRQAEMLNLITPSADGQAGPGGIGPMGGPGGPMPMMGRGFRR
jgi:hypothetical protein